MVSNVNLNLAPQDDKYTQIKKERDELDLRVLLNNNVQDHQAAQTQTEKDSIFAVIQNILASLNDGTTAPALQTAAQQAAGTTGTTGTTTDATGKPLTKGQMEANDKSVDGFKTKEDRKALMKDLASEFDINKAGNFGEWINADKNSDKITLLEGGFATDKNGDQKWKKGSIVEVQSEKYGTVKIQVGGDGSMNGADETILAVGNKAATENAQAGLQKTIGQGTAQQLNGALPAQLNAQEGIDGLGNLGDTDISQLIAAIMAQLNQVNV